jgi:hypothetical protein
MSAHALLELAVAAAGGVERWQRVRELRATVSSGGLAYNGRLRGASHHLKISASPSELRTVVTPFPKPGYRGVFDRGGVQIETDDGRVVRRRDNPRELCVNHRIWDDLDLLYFKGYAQWGYLNEPFYLLMPGIEVSEGKPLREGAESWRRLDVVFPRDFPAHSSEQSYYFDERGDLRRHDYAAHVFGGKRSAHYHERFREYSGFRVATRRRVFPRAANGEPRRWLKLIWVELEDLQVVFA